MTRLAALLLPLLMSAGCTADFGLEADQAAVCSAVATSPDADDTATFADLDAHQWSSSLQWTDTEVATALTIELAVDGEAGAAIDRALATEAGWAEASDCGRTLEAPAVVSAWTADGRLDADFEGSVVVTSGEARFGGDEVGGSRSLAVTLRGEWMSGVVLDAASETASDSDTDGVSLPSASWPAE